MLQLECTSGRDIRTKNVHSLRGKRMPENRLHRTIDKGMIVFEMMNFRLQRQCAGKLRDFAMDESSLCHSVSSWLYCLNCTTT
jgi:hypothetical protein